MMTERATESKDTMKVTGRWISWVLANSKQPLTDREIIEELKKHGIDNEMQIRRTLTV